MKASKDEAHQVARAGLLLAWLLAAALACQRQSQPNRVRGVVIGVEARSLARADRLVLRTEEGRQLTLDVAPEVSWTPGHLREHMAQGEPVVIEYRADGDGLLVVRIDDSVNK
jgi:hypothetical protein